MENKKRFFLKYCDFFFFFSNLMPFSSEEHVASQKKVTPTEDLLPTRSRFLLARRSQLHLTVTTTTVCQNLAYGICKKLKIPV